MPGTVAAPMSQPIPSPSGPCTPAAPPSRSEVERKLSFKSAASQSPRKKKRSPSNVSGNDSDTSLSSAQGLSQSASLASPILSPSLTLGGSSNTIPAPPSSNRQLSAIAERLRGNQSVVEEVEEYEEHDEGEDVSDEEDQGEADPKAQGELERGMEGERVLRAGYLYKKQEKRKVWKKKWFVLRTGKLAYYKDDREYSLSRVMDLRIIHTAAPVKVKKHSFTFGIVTKKRTFLVEASSQSEMDEWVAAISNARRRLTEDEEKRSAPTTRQPSGQMPEQPPQGDGYVSAGGYASSAAGTSPVINTSYLGRSTATPINSSPAQMYPTTGLPSSSYTSDSGMIGQMSRVNIGAHQSQPVGAMRSPSAPTAPGQPIRSFTRREPSASSLSSAGADYFPRTPSAGQSPQPPAIPVGHGVSSDSEELEGEGDLYFSDMASRSQLGTSVGTAKTGFSSMAPGSVGGFMQGGGQVDPARVILSAYLMKRSKGRGRKVWRKRWFYLTSQGLTYTKSHMDTKPLRNIPLSSILDAIDQSSALDSVDPSSSDSDTPARPIRSPSTSKFPSPPQRQPSSSGTAFGAGFGGAQPKDDEHTFRLVTAKRNYVLCAPSEEDEIKWLAAVKALLNRERGVGSPVSEMPPRLLSPGMGYAGQAQGGQGWGTVPVITQQPPTPGGASGGGAGGQVGAAGQGGVGQGQTMDQAQAQQVQGQVPMSIGQRGRSATYLAKSAVADVERRYHPEQQQQAT